MNKLVATMNLTFPENLSADIDAVNKIPIIADLLDIICRTTGMGFAAVARVTDDKWIACSVQDNVNFGLKPGGELKLETTICNEIRQHRNTVAFDDVNNDPAYKDHHTPKLYGLQSYISVPIILKNGQFFGTLCAIDPQPGNVNNRETISMFVFYAELISFHLQAIEQLKSTENLLSEEKELSELRDQFIAILGHDLRNPVAAVSSVAELLLRMPLEDRVLKLVNIVKDSSFRMRELIDNVLDFAKARLGEGITLSKSTLALDETILHIIEELEQVWPDRKINFTNNIKSPVNCDAKRIAQLFSNLLSNALSHGEKSEPVSVEAYSDSENFTLSVINPGTKISDAVMQRLFRPFSRGDIKPGQDGLGLGLYISSQIASAHKGHLNAASTAEETRFTFTMPMA